MARLALLGVLLLACAAVGAVAQNSASTPSAQPDFLGRPPPVAPGVEVQAWFPNHPRKQFPLGEAVDVVVGFSNGGEEMYNVTAIVGSLHSPAQWNLWVQNFTAKPVDVSVKPGEQASLQYTFRPEKMLPPREFLVAVHVFYHGLAVAHHSLAFNQTIDIVELPQWVDFELLGLYVISALILAAVGFLVFKQLQSVGWVRAATKRRGQKTNIQTASSNDPAQWLKGTHYDSFARAKAKRADSGSVKKAT